MRGMPGEHLLANDVTYQNSNQTEGIKNRNTEDIPNPSGAPGIDCLSCVKAKRVATGMRRTSPRCLNPKKTVVIITNSKISVIIPVKSLVRYFSTTTGDDTSY